MMNKRKIFAAILVLFFFFAGCRGSTVHGTVMDVTPEIGLSRVDNRGQGRDRFESEKVEFFTRVRNCYLSEASSDPSIKVIDATQPLEQVKQSVRTVLEDFLCSRG